MSEYIRKDGRKPNELRPIKIEAGVLERADGSAYLEFGGNKILVAVYGPRESYIRRLLKPNTNKIKRNLNELISFIVPLYKSYLFLVHSIYT